MFVKFKEENENEKNFMCNYVGNIVNQHVNIGV